MDCTIGVDPTSANVKQQRKSSNRGWAIAFWLYFLILLAIFVGAYLKVLPPQLTVYDKLGHFILLGIASFLSHQVLGRRTVKALAFRVPIGPLLVTFFSLIDEGLQVLSSARSFSLIDLGANWIGIWVFYWVGEKIRRYQNR